jgi:hypothetical protein
MDIPSGGLHNERRLLRCVAHINGRFMTLPGVAIGQMIECPCGFFERFRT